MLRYIALGIVATSLLIAAQLFRGSQQEDAQSNAESSQSSATADTLSSPAQIQADVSRTRGRVSGITEVTSPDEQIENLQEPSIAKTDPTAVQAAWEEDLEEPIAPARFLNKGISVRALKLNRGHLTQASRGSELSLSIPQTGRDYTMAVTQVGKHQNGDKTLKGHLKGNSKYAVVMTQGARATFATVNTPDGSFLLEANENQGWILATTDLNGLIDPNVVDYMIPEITR